MTTEHAVRFQSAVASLGLQSQTVDLVITSPPYPMIEMWDSSFAEQDPTISRFLEASEGDRAFERMHLILDDVWKQCVTVVRPGGFVCINIGDATRSLNGNFRLYTNHSRITSKMEALGFQSLPAIIWRKQTNAPNKFMGSGMLPSGAYVTLEHEYILVFRNGGKRTVDGEDRERRQTSAYFWEERNTWFSDLWDFKGTRQQLDSIEARRRSGAFPFELAFRLINMYSMQRDLVLDPFLGTGTTMLAAMASGRSSLGIEIEPSMGPSIIGAVKTAAPTLNDRQAQRIADHLAFVERTQVEKGKHFKHRNEFYDFPVMTSQETRLRIPLIDTIRESAPHRFVAEHVDYSKKTSPVQVHVLEHAGMEKQQLSLSFVS